MHKLKNLRQSLQSTMTNLLLVLPYTFQFIKGEGNNKYICSTINQIINIYFDCTYFFLKTKTQE